MKYYTPQVCLFPFIMFIKCLYKIALLILFIQQFLPVHNDHIFADRILPVINPAFLHNLLGMERDQHSCGLCGQGTQSVDLSWSKRQRRILKFSLLSVGIPPFFCRALSMQALIFFYLFVSSA